MRRFCFSLALALFAAPVSYAQIPAMPAMPSRPMIPMNRALSMSSIDLQDPMAQEASGTAWLPASSPVYAAMVMRPW